MGFLSRIDAGFERGGDFTYTHKAKSSLTSRYSNCAVFRLGDNVKPELKPLLPEKAR